MGQIDSLAFLSSGKENCKEVECPQFLQVKRGKSTSTSVKKIYISTVFYHYFLHSTMIFSHFSPSTMTFTFYISTTFLSSFLHSTSSKKPKYTIYSSPPSHPLSCKYLNYQHFIGIYRIASLMTL